MWHWESLGDSVFNPWDVAPVVASSCIKAHYRKASSAFPLFGPGM
jgi:hypothetical protein